MTALMCVEEDLTTRRGAKMFTLRQNISVALALPYNGIDSRVSTMSFADKCEATQQQHAGRRKCKLGRSQVASTFEDDEEEGGRRKCLFLLCR